MYTDDRYYIDNIENETLTMEPIKNNHGMLSVSCTIRRIYFASRETLPMPSGSSEFESLDLNDVFVDFVLVAPSNTNNIVYVDGWNPRQEFEQEMKKVGLLFEEDVVDELVFIKIHVPLKVLRKYCGIMKLRMPVKRYNLKNIPENRDINDDSIRCFSSILNIFKSNGPESEILTTEYSNEISYIFDEKDPNFFSEEVRILVVDFILNKINWGKKKDNLDTVGFQNLLDKGVYKAAYPLHDGGCDLKNSCRHKLFTEWASVGKCLQRQPIDQIKEYMGVKYAFYFAWLGFYTYMLIPVTVLGVVVILYGIITLPSNSLSSDICNATNTFMCPPCDKYCEYWVLSTACLYSKLLYIIDNDLTIIYAFVMSIWATLFLEIWKRYAASITHHWGLTSLNLDSEYPRSKYLAKLTNSKQPIIIKNVVTGEIEPIVTFRRKMSVFCISYSILLLCLMITIAFVLAVIAYRMAAISSSFAKNLGFIDIHIFTSITAGILNLICIQFLNLIYGRIAVFLTEIELPRTQHEFDETLLVKIYIFKFINCYTSIIYIAFWKGKWVGYPDHYFRIFDWRQEECAPGGCLMELSIQLFIIMVGQQVLNAFIEMIFPVCMKWYYSWTSKISYHLKKNPTSETGCPIKEKTPWLEDYKLLDLGPRGLLPEYLEMVLQYGFVTLFVSAFPLSPLFALLNNVFELRLDAQKFLKYYRRPIPNRVPDIGVWYRILDIIGYISVVTNAIIIAFNSNFIPRLMYMAIVNENHTDSGFLDYSLVKFHVNDNTFHTKYKNITECQYQVYVRNGTSNEYERTPFFYQLLIARLIFIFLFQNVLYLIKLIIQWMIPDMPKSLKDRIKRESFLITQMMMEKDSQSGNIV